MKLLNTIYDLIVEAAPEEIYKKYYSDIDKKTFNRIISLDPATKIEGETIKRIGKYSKLLIKMFKNGNLKSEDFPKATDYLTLVYKHNVPVDINKIKTLGDLFGLVEKHYSSGDNNNVFELLKVLDDSEYNLLLNGEKWIIYTPKSEKAAAYLGNGTEWCTAWGPYSTKTEYRNRRNHFTSHNNQGSLYVIINKEDPTDKYQFHFETKQFMDKNDRGIKTANFFDNHPEVTKYFYPSLYEDSGVDEEEVSRMGFLSDELSKKLINRVIEGTDNPIVDALMESDPEEMIKSFSKYVTDDSVNITTETQQYYSTTNNVIFTISDINNELYDLYETLRQYQYDSDPYADHRDQLRYDVTEQDEEWQEEKFEELVKELWDSGYVTFTNDYKVYRDLMHDELDSIIDDYATEYSDINDPLVVSASETEVNKIEKYITITEDGNDFEITVPPSQLALFIFKEGLTQITDVESLLEVYISHHGLDYEYENPMYNMNLEYPKFSDMKTTLEGYADRVEEIFNESPECMEEKKKLAEVITKYFKYNRYESEDMNITINGGVDCEKMVVPVYISYVDRSQNEDGENKNWRGHITVEKILEYVTNERLFEEF